MANSVFSVSPTSQVQSTLIIFKMPQNLEQRTAQLERDLKVMPHSSEYILLYLTERIGSSTGHPIYKDSETGRFFIFKRVEEDLLKLMYSYMPGYTRERHRPVTEGQNTY